MNTSSILTYRMIVCSECKSQHSNHDFDCYGSDDDIENCEELL